jgi:N-formylglutamate amidohydrolase
MSSEIGAGDSSAPIPHGIDALILPEWVLFHVPHDSTWVPPSVRNQFLLNDEELKTELLRMTDHWTFDLFAQGIPARRVVQAGVSRLVVDVERFEEDALEIMASRGMGAVYEHTSDGRQLRHSPAPDEREELMDAWYHPHHERLMEIVQETINQRGVALLLDAHSFPSRPLPYELEQGLARPDICIGTDEFHTPEKLVQAFLRAFGDVGWTVGLNTPFGGALVPMPLYRKERRLTVVMVEVNRALYIDEATGERRTSFTSVAEMIRQCVVSAISSWKQGSG